MESAFLKLISDFGIVPVLIFLVIFLWFLVREIKKELASVSKALSGVREALENKIDALQDHSDKRDAEIRDDVHALCDRVGYMEKEYLTREEHYKVMGGWREEMWKLHKANDRVVELLAGALAEGR